MQTDNLLAPLVQLGKALMACIMVAHAKTMRCFAKTIKTSVCRVYSGDYGANTITNYNVNKDVLQLDKSAFGDLASMISDGGIKQSGTSTIITNSHNALDTITLNNVSPTLLETKGHFSFV